MNPSQAYERLNRLLWNGRLPTATIVILGNPTIPKHHGLALDDCDVFRKPVILLNHRNPGWGRTLVHEMLHIAEPNLSHGVLFDSLVTQYWRLAKKNIKHIQKSRRSEAAHHVGLNQTSLDTRT